MSGERAQGVEIEVNDEPISDPPVYDDPRLQVRSSVPCEVAVFLGTAAHDAGWLRDYLERPKRTA